MAKAKDGTSEKEREEGARQVIRDVLRVGLADGADEPRREARLRNSALEYMEARPGAADFADRLFGAGAADPMVRWMCADWLERALPPSSRRDCILQVLRSVPVFVPGVRNAAICNAVDAAVEMYGFKKTRNPAQQYKGGGHSACSLVAEELGTLGIADIGEDAILKICNAPVPVETISPEHLKLRLEVIEKIRSEYEAMTKKED